MKTILSGLGYVLVLVLVIGLSILLIALLGNANSGFTTSRPPALAVGNGSPLATPTFASARISPLGMPDIPNAPGVPLAHIGAPMLVYSLGSARLLNGDQGKIAMISWEGDKTFITVLNLTTGKASKIADGALFNARLAGHWLIGEDHPPVASTGYYSRIKVIDVDTGEEILLGDISTNQQSPGISENMVVWQDWRNQEKSGLDIYGYDLATGKEFPVVVKPGPNSAPRISGQWVVYVEPTTQGKDLADLRAHSLKTGEDFLIGIIPAPNKASNGTYHAIDGDKVAWMKVTNATWPQFTSEPHLYDLTTRTDRQLAGPIQNGAPTDVSLSATSGVVVYNSPTQGWVVVDWLPSTPVSIPVIAPQKSIGEYLITTGDYLVWEIYLNLEFTTGHF